MTRNPITTMRVTGRAAAVGTHSPTVPPYEHSAGVGPAHRLEPPGRPPAPDFAKLMQAFEAAVLQGKDGLDQYGEWRQEWERYDQACTEWNTAAGREHERLTRLYGDVLREARRLAHVVKYVGCQQPGTVAPPGQPSTAEQHAARAGAWRALAAEYDPAVDWSAVEPSNPPNLPLPPRPALTCGADPTYRPPDYSVARDRIINQMAAGR